ncbi:Topoisomerase DNA binding C4 zinc finger [Virgibacillus subterraneus]|uniref:Topoisomerase DNA binding C4 zinc finger n=1 Tax=Virgibacillus subterraneus TaxID=621109 RepID=A0A1H9GGE3_9BACI|nr:DUF2726 domain-containing protein [Virgibacillus subterraneus]SEQ49182.1 Topoisomerase DNA binding C4 zinc finger [Virgibacillus subterraneus]
MSNNNPGCLGIFFKFIGRSPKENVKEETKLPYAMRDDFLSNAELSFYKVLQQYIGNRAIICPKVSLQDIFFVHASNQSERSTYNNKISRKHVDFLLCSTDTVKPICGIELDDRSHQRADRIERDKFVEEVFEIANLRLVRFQNKKAYSFAEIQEKLDSVLEDVDRIESKHSQEVTTDSNNGSVPQCKKCGVPMVKREAKKGDYKGQEFYGCPNFPKCREVVYIS